MDRRKFIKTSLCAGCAAALALGCKNIKLSDPESQKFIYKNKSELPKKIRIDACTLCQLHCVKCPLKRDTDEYLKKTFGLGYLKFENFRKLVDDNFFEEIELSRAGEILLNPDLDKIIEHAYTKDISLTAYNGVNLNTLSDKTAENLVKYKFRHLTVSMDAATPETYAIYRRGGDFNKVVENIKKINFYKEKYNSKYPEMLYKFILFGHNEHEIEKAKEKAKKLNMEIGFALNNAPDYSPIKNIELVKKQTGKTFLKDSCEMQYNKYKTGKSDWFFCLDLFRAPFINWDGRFFGCCVTSNTVGFKVNVFEKDLLSALNSEPIVYAKKLLTDFSTKPRDDIPCSNCKTYKWMKENNAVIFTKN